MAVKTTAAERRAADRERLKAAAEALLTSEGWKQWVGVRSRNGLARYSMGNQLLIARCRPQTPPTSQGSGRSST